jgi:hypothetical protein
LGVAPNRKLVAHSRLDPAASGKPATASVEKQSRRHALHREISEEFSLDAKATPTKFDVGRYALRNA